MEFRRTPAPHIFPILPRIFYDLCSACVTASVQSRFRADKADLQSACLRVRRSVHGPLCMPPSCSTGKSAGSFKKNAKKELVQEFAALSRAKVSLDSRPECRNRRLAGNRCDVDGAIFSGTKV
jgi:hypothetical protein